MEHQISIFDMEPLTKFQQALQRGSCFAKGKERIYSAALRLSFKDFVEYVKKEYGLGGFSFNDGFVDFNAKGMSMWKWRSDDRSSYSWTEVAKGIKQLIAIDNYLTQKEKDNINRIEKE